MLGQLTERTRSILVDAASQVAAYYHTNETHPLHIFAVFLTLDRFMEPGEGKPLLYWIIFILLEKDCQETLMNALVEALSNPALRVMRALPGPPNRCLGVSVTTAQGVAIDVQSELEAPKLSSDLLLIGVLKNRTVQSVCRAASLDSEVLIIAIRAQRRRRGLESDSTQLTRPRRYSNEIAIEDENKKIRYETPTFFSEPRNIKASKKTTGPPKKPEESSSKNDVLDQFGVDMTKLAEDGKLDPVFGRDDEVRRMIEILSRRTKNNVVLIGEPGVGKTALAESLALRIVARDVPESLMARLYSLNMGKLRAGATFRGQYEQRVRSVIDAVEQAMEGGTNIILFIDEFHLIMSGHDRSDEMDAANLLKPMLARGKLRCIGATTLTEYQKHIEKDSAFERRFAQVLVNEPSVEDTIQILRGIKGKYEAHHDCRISDPALVHAATLARRYVPHRRLPDSAIDLIDEACAAVHVAQQTVPPEIDTLERRKLSIGSVITALEKERDKDSKARLEDARRTLADTSEKLRPLMVALEQRKARPDKIQDLNKRIQNCVSKADDAERRYDGKTVSHLHYYVIPALKTQLEELEAIEQEDKDRADVTPEAIEKIVTRWTGIPISKVASSESEKLLKMESVMNRQVVGQPEAVKAVVNAVLRSRSGLGNEGKPIASFLFAGPSGTGKTLLAKTLAQILFDSPDAMIRIDGSEYSEKHSISRLIGAPPGYVGHGDGGQLTDYIRRKPYSIVLIDEIEKASTEFVLLFLQVLDNGRLTDSKGRVISFKNTVIIATSNLGGAHLTGIGDGSIPERVRAKVMRAIETYFPPEFRNRLDDTIIYRPLARQHIHKIVDVRLKEMSTRLKSSRNLILDVNDRAKAYLADAGYSSTLGARPLNRVLQNEISNPLAVMLLQQKINDGEKVKIRLGKDHKLFIRENHRGIPDSAMQASP